MKEVRDDKMRGWQDEGMTEDSVKRGGQNQKRLPLPTTLDADAAAMRPDDVLDDRQSQPGASLTRTARRTR